MGYIEAVVLAVIQGLTEFLPVSSSGHLVLAQHWFGQFTESHLLYDVMLHLATVTAIVVYFKADLLTLAKGYLGVGAGETESIFQGHERQTIHLVILASIPTALLGIGVELFGFAKLAQPSIVAMMLILTGGILWVGRNGNASRGAKDMNARDAVVIGFIQGMAILPGISRSGSTIAGGMLLGLDRELAARFSLLISIPAIVGATILELWKVLGTSHEPLGTYFVGMAVAALVGYGSIAVILRLVRQNHFHFFSFYLWPLGVAILLWGGFQ